MLSRFSGIRLLVVLLMLPGFLVALHRCHLRLAIEEQDTQIETVMDFEELRQLAREEGWSLARMLETIVSHGASSVGISEDTLASLQSEGRLHLLSPLDLQRLIVEGTLSSTTSALFREPGALWVHSREPRLLDRIQLQLSWKLPVEKVERVSSTILVVNKSGPDFRTRVGVGFSPEFIGLARVKGLGVVLRLFNYPGLTPESIRRIVESLPEPDQVSALLFAEEEVLGNRGAIDAMLLGLLKKPFRIGWVEFNDQGGMERLLTLKGRLPFVKVHSIGRREMDEIYNIERATARWIRSVRDRRLKMLYIRCFFQDKKKYIGDVLKFNMDYLGSLVRRLRSAGYRIAENDTGRRTEKRYDMPPIPGWQRMCMGFSLMLGFPLLVAISRKRGIDAHVVGLTISTAGIFFFMLTPTLYITTAGIVGAISFSTLGVIWAMVRFEEHLPQRQSYSRLLGATAGFFWRLVTPAIFGGVLVAGMYSESDYLLKFLQFRGIKAAFLLPLVWVGIWSIRKYGGALLEYISQPLCLRDVLIGLAVTGGVSLYLLRSGNVTFLKPSESEDLIRTFLENLLLARPRNKEFLIGYPAVFFFLFFRLRQSLAVLPVFALFMQMGQVSVLNTFCHFHSPLTMAFVRAFNGLWTGILIGAGLLTGYYLCRLIAAFSQKQPQGVVIGYFGFGNLGDEFLCHTFLTHAQKACPDFSWHVLAARDHLPGLPANTHVIPRSSLFALLETLAASKYLVIPGGGVLQAATSYSSLLYYLSLLVIGRLFGARLLLPSQGFGPWAPRAPGAESEVPTSLLKAVTRFVLDFADFLSLRDTESRGFLQELPPPPVPAEISGDLAFAGELPPRTRSATATGPLRVGVLLRGSNPESPRILRLLQEVNAKFPDITLTPLAFQNHEDEAIWQETGLPVHLVTIEQLQTPENPLSGLDLVIAMRLHGCIFATMMGLPWIGLAYDQKILGFAGEIGWDHVITPAEATPEHLERLLRQSLSERPERSEQLLSATATRRARVTRDLELCLARLRRPLSASSPISPKTDNP